MLRKNEAPAPATSAEGDVVRMLDEILRHAVSSRASDIHIEPKEDRLRVRMRIDGVMVERATLPATMATALVSRIKVLGKMDIAERRNPQDGTFKVELTGGPTAFRASTFPCVEGEKVVLRILSAGALISLERLGMTPPQMKLVRAMAARTGGLLLVTGPTGAGKSSTLYGVMSELDVRRRNVVTLEDPIEVPLAEITQGQVNPKAGFTFAAGLRAILRQDPDVILVGEMRDEETAAIAVQASLTGHLVLSTLHANSSLDTVTRLVDIGLEPYTVAAALIGVVNQRLVRTVCQCATPFQLEGDLSEECGFPLPQNARVLRANGCDECLGTGYKGRCGIFEVVEFDDPLRLAIKQRVETNELKQMLRQRGIPTVRRAGMRLALQGRTTPEEVLRVT
jgi:general secretion pathway protein E